MPALTRDVIRKLAASRNGSGNVVSLYLDVDGSRYVRPKDYEFHLEKLLREARDRLGAAPEDIERMQRHLAELDRSNTRGVAIFSAVNRDLFEVFELPVPVRNHVSVNTAPHVGQLEALLEHYEPIAVLMVDRQRFRMLLFELGTLVDKSEFSEPLPRHEDDKGDWDRDHVHDHVDAAAQRHVRHAAQRAFEVFQEQRFAHLVIAAPDELAKAVERELHPYLRDRLAGRISLPTTARDADIRKAALEIEERTEREREAKTVEKLRAAVGSGNGGVAGLPDVLAALGQRRVHTLVVSDGFTAEGWVCPGCGGLAVRGSACPQCSGRMTQVDDVVEEGVDRALLDGCRVVVCRGNADLDVLGRVGALLRF